jgi:uncharacterized coiled-coil protein SlyX
MEDRQIERKRLELDISALNDQVQQQRTDMNKQREELNTLQNNIMENIEESAAKELKRLQLLANDSQAEVYPVSYGY